MPNKNAGDAPSPSAISPERASPKQPKEGSKEVLRPRKAKRSRSDSKPGGRSAPAMDTLQEGLDIPKSPSQILADEAERRANERRNRFKRRWPEVTKPAFSTRPWHPPAPPRRPPAVKLALPELKLRRWVPPYLRRRRRRARLPRVPPEEVTKELYEYAKLKKIYHQFSQVERNKMMLRGSLACDSKKYRGNLCGAQTACIAFVARALLHDKTPAQLVRRDVDDVIEAGDQFYRQCLLQLKCYKGKPELELNQLLRSFYFREHKYTVDTREVARGVLAKHPDDNSDQDLMTLMEQRAGQPYWLVLSVGARHFLAWGGLPAAAEGAALHSVCYLFDPHMNNDIGQPDRTSGCSCRYSGGGAAFLRYAGVTSFVLDFVANYGGLDATKRGCPVPRVVLTSIEVISKEPLERAPRYQLDLQALPAHCEAEWRSLHQQALVERKHQGEYPLQSLSAVSLATSRSAARRKLREFYQKIPKEPAATLPMAPERGPAGPTTEQLMSLRGEDFFLNCPRGDGHAYGRDDMVPRAKSEEMLYSAVDVAQRNFPSQFHQLDAEKWILRATRHMASHRYQTFKTYTAVSCCVAALGALRRLRARAWCEDTLDDTLDLGYNLYRESLLARGGPVRRLVLGELADAFAIRDRHYTHKEQGIAVWGKLVSNTPQVFDLCRGLDEFFNTSDAGILQVPGEFETAIWNEGGVYYLYVPWPADRYGARVGLREGGKACLVCFARVSGLCDHFLASTRDLRRKPFSISAVLVRERPPMPEPVNQLKPVAPARWVVRGSFHEGDARFPEEHRGRQATPTALAAIAYAHVVPPHTWTSQDVDETLIRGDSLYETTMENLEKLGVSMEAGAPGEVEDEEAAEVAMPAGMLAAADVANRFRVTDYDCIETDVQDSAFSGSLTPVDGVMSLREALRRTFAEAEHAVLTARGVSLALMRVQDKYYMFDPHGCDENGYVSDDVRAAACLVCVDSVGALAAAVESNLPPGVDDSFNISPVEVTPTKLNMELGAPEPKLESKSFEWVRKGTAAMMLGPRGEHAAAGRAASRAGVGEEDKAGRTLALPAAAAFAAAAAAVPPPHMHRDHMYNLLDAGADYYLQHVKKTGSRSIAVKDLAEKFEMGANTFSVELGEPVRLPLRLPDEPTGEGAEAGEMPGEVEESIKEMKDLLNKMWNDQTKPKQTALLLGDYHQLGVWLAAGGPVVAFDPAPTLPRLLLTEHRIQKGDELRLQRIKDEMGGEGGADEEEEAGAEGEEQPEPEPTAVPRDAAPALMVFASPAELIDKLVFQGPLDRKQSLAPYKLYPVTVTNELTALLRDQRGSPAAGEEEADEESGPTLVEALSEEARGVHMRASTRTVAALRGRLALHENYFMEPARDHQDAAIAVVAIVAAHIEPYVHWRPALVDALVQYGDRLYTRSLPRARRPPRLAPSECASQFHLTSFNVRTTLGEETSGDLKAGAGGPVLSLRRGIAKFLETNEYGVLCAKEYCVAVWRGAGGRAACMLEPHGVGPAGRASGAGGAALLAYSTPGELADVFRANVEELDRPGSNKFTITPVSVEWQLATPAARAAPAGAGAAPDDGYEHKVLTAYVETARGRTILRGSRPADAHKFCREAVLQSAASAVVGACLAHLRRPHLWTRHTVDQVMSEGCKLFAASISSLGYEFHPGDDVLMPLQVLKRFVLGSNYVRVDLQELYSGRLELARPTGAVDFKSALQHFFEHNRCGIVWCSPFAAAVWRAPPPAPPALAMLEPHAAGRTGLRAPATDDCAACVLTFTSAKLMAHAYLQNIPPTERFSRNFHLYNISVRAAPIRPLPADPPLVRSSPNVRLVPATSKVGVSGQPRRAAAADRRPAPGAATCRDAQRAADKHDQEQANLKGRRNANGWLVLQDGSQFLSARHSIACRKFPHGSRGKQALACCVMAVAMSRVRPVCRWCASTLDAVLLGGDQLHQDSCLHYRPPTGLLQMEQVLRKLYAPGNCVCRVVVFQPRQQGQVDADLPEQLAAFFAEEKQGVLVAGEAGFAVALFKTTRGFYMFDPADRDRCGRAAPPPCRGRARACLSQYPTVQSLAAKLAANIPPEVGDADEDTEEKPKEEAKSEAPSDSGQDEPKVTFAGKSATFKIYGMVVTGLRRLNHHEK